MIKERSHCYGGNKSVIEVSYVRTRSINRRVWGHQLGNIFSVRGGQNTRPDPKNLGSGWFGLLLKLERVKNYKPDRVVFGSGKTRSDPNTRSGRTKKNSLNL